MASSEGYLVNTSSVNGFWAYIAPNIPQTAYAAAKFAASVRGPEVPEGITAFMQKRAPKWASPRCRWT